jgi:hypothetical protein
VGFYFLSVWKEQSVTLFLKNVGKSKGEARLRKVLEALHMNLQAAFHLRLKQ